MRALSRFGEERNGITPANPPNDQEKFATYTRDSATGLDYADQRYFSSVIGRFLRPDPFRRNARAFSPQSWNRYAYVGNDPANLVDPRGLNAQFLDSEGDGGGDFEEGFGGYADIDDPNVNPQTVVNVTSDDASLAGDTSTPIYAQEPGLYIPIGEEYGQAVYTSTIVPAQTAVQNFLCPPGGTGARVMQSMRFGIITGAVRGGVTGAVGGEIVGSIPGAMIGGTIEGNECSFHRLS